MYTHRGWNFSEYPDNAFWKTRQKILLETVQQELFGDSNPLINWVTYKVNSLMGPSEQCEAFCRMVYCIHILGDHTVGDKPGKLAFLLPLARPHDELNPGIIPELKDCLQILFADQNDGWTYMALMNELDIDRMKAEELYSSDGGIYTEEKCAANIENAKELLCKLGEYIPKLLRNEEFFAQVFPVS